MRPGQWSRKPWFAVLLAAGLLPGISAAAAAEPTWYDAPTPLHPVAIDAELTARWIREDAFVITHEPAAQSNVLAVKMRDGTLVLCSSPFDTEATRTMLRWIRKVFAPRRIVAINTHFHPDGTAGNEAYAEAHVETWGSELTRRLLAQRGERVREQSAAAMNDPKLAARVRATRIVPAAHTFADATTLAFGFEKVRVLYPGPGHSPDNVVVHFPSRKLLFGGCLIKAGRTIGNTADADLAHWEAAVQAIAGLPAAVVVPGHGPSGGPELLRNTVEVVRAARAR